MDPVSIGRTFGWFSQGRNRRGVILCGTFGFEQHSAHRWWRDLSEGIADTGCAVLRFDYPGEGDSAGDSIQLDTALDAIRRAIRFMQDEVQAESICIVGLRLGATLATLVAQEGGIDRLVLLAPFAQGRVYLREMAIKARVIDVVPNGTPLPKRPGLLSVGGFVLAPDLKQDLAQIDLRAVDQLPVKHILLLGPDPASLAAQFVERGVRVEAGVLPGLASLVSDAFQTRMPEATRARILDFVSEGIRPRTAQPPLRPTIDAAITDAGWSEEPVRFGGGLFAIRCRPSTSLSWAPAVLFINMGANVHSGYGRQTTSLARILAQNGVASLRMDLGGVGDSLDRPSGELPFYNPDAVADVRAALDALTQGAARPVIAVGTCNGAYLAFQAICQDRRIAAAICVNLYCFDWALNHGGEPYAIKPIRRVSTYAAMLLKGATWRRILGGVTPLGMIIRSLVRRECVRLLDKLVGHDKPADRSRSIVERITEVRRRGAKLVLLYSAGDLGLKDLHTQLGSLDQAAAVLGKPVQVVAAADHMFSAEPAQAALLNELQELVSTMAGGHYAHAACDLSSSGRIAAIPQLSLEVA